MKSIIGLIFAGILLSSCASTSSKEPETSIIDEATVEKDEGLEEESNMEVSQTNSDVELEEIEVTDDYLMLMSDTMSNMESLIETYGSIATAVQYGMRGDQLKTQADTFNDLALDISDRLTGVKPPAKYKKDHMDLLSCLYHIIESSNDLKKFARTENEELLTQAGNEFSNIVDYASAFASMKIAIKNDLN